MNQEILRFNKYRLIKITLLRKLQLEHSSEIIFQLAGRIADHIEQKKRGTMSSIKSWITNVLSAGLYQDAYGPGYLLAWGIRLVWKGFKSV
jgi:hypothetical protein